MSAGIQNALINLNAKIEALSQVADQKLQAPKKSGQPDLFSVVSGGAKKPVNANALDTKMLASRLDSAISKVEQILKEGKA